MPHVVPAEQVRDAEAAYDVESSTEHFSGHVIAVRSDVVRMPDGDTARRDVVVHPWAVGVVAMDDEDRVLLVQQYRHPPRRLLWEPPAGLLDDDAAGETPCQAAARELFEEAGYRAATWSVLVDVFTSPGMSDEALRIFLARDITEVGDEERHVGVHEEADMPLSWVPLELAVAKVLAGELHNPTAVAGVLAAYASKQRGLQTLRPADSSWPERPF